MSKAQGYKREYAAHLVAYFSAEPYQECIETVWHSNGAVRSERVLRVPNRLPTFERFAAELGVSAERLKEWEAQHEAFARAAGRARELQRDFLMQNALLGLYNAAFAKLAAEAVCGMQEAHTLTIEAAPRIVDDLPRDEDD